MTILVTGSDGLVGANLIPHLHAKGFDVAGFDISHALAEDTRDPGALERAFGKHRITGVVHLAAVSRVVWAEQDPENCERTNIGAVKTLLALCLRQRVPPWVIFASSREVYGRQSAFPVSESTPYEPINVYGRSKVEGERLIDQARRAGLTANICRLSSVYGWPHDHPDRVAMAFARAAAHGGSIVLEGAGNVFDFTFVDDVAQGLLSLVEVTNAGVILPPIQFVGGVGTSLADLARFAAEFACQPLSLSEAAPRNFDVGHFVGDPSRAASLLGWRARTDVRSGLATLIGRLRDSGIVKAPPPPAAIRAFASVAEPVQVAGMAD